MSETIDYDKLLDDAAPQPRRRPGPPPEPEVPAVDPPWTWDHLIILTAITVFAGVLRLYKIGEWSFWIDEVHTLRDAILKTPAEFWQTPTSRYPISFELLRWLQPWLPGSGEGSYRLLFAFFGIISVPLLGVVVRRILGVGPALLAALFLAISPWHLYWSQNCRAYTLVLFLALASLSVFWVGVERGKGHLLLLSIVIAGTAALTHPSAFFLVPAFLAYLVVLKSRHVEWPKLLDKKALMWLVAPVGLGLLFVLGNFVKIWEVYEFAKGERSFFHLANTTVFFVRVPVIVAAIGGSMLLWNRSRRTCLFLAATIIAPTLLVALTSFKVKTTAQYLFFTLPAWLALAGYGAWALSQWTRFRGASLQIARGVLLGMIVLDMASQDHLYLHYRYGDRPRWREAATYIQRHGSPEDIVASTNEPCMEWYLNPSPLRLSWTVADERRKVVELLADWTLEKLSDWKQRADELDRRFWVVLTEPVLEVANPDKSWDRWLRKHFRQALRLPNWTGPKDMTVLVYVYDPNEAASDEDAKPGKTAALHEKDARSPRSSR